MTYKTLVQVNQHFQVLAGNCLAMAQGIVGAPIMHPSATAAANATRYRHEERTLPDAVCVIWLDHWGSYGKPGQEVWDNWGHVAVYVPGVGIASSSPVAGEVSGPYWYATIADIENAFAASYRFWSEDINGLRVCEPTPVEPTKKKKEYIMGKYTPAKPGIKLAAKWRRLKASRTSTKLVGKNREGSITLTAVFQGAPGSQVQLATAVEKQVGAGGAVTGKRGTASGVIPERGVLKLQTNRVYKTGANECLRPVAIADTGKRVRVTHLTWDITE